MAQVVIFQYLRISASENKASKGLPQCGIFPNVDGSRKPHIGEEPESCLPPTAAAVKFDLPSTPEQKACSKSIDEGLNTFWTLVERLQNAPISSQPIHQVEETVFRQLLIVGRWMLQAFLDMAGSGDVGPTMIVAGDSPTDPDQELPRLEQTRTRPYLSIFGEISIERTCYGHERVEAVPLDAQLHLPQRQYSYLLQQWLGTFVVDDAHAEAIRKLEAILGLEIAVKASEDLNREQACDVEPYQNNLPVPEPTEEGPILVVTADCKGVPLVRSALAPEEATEPPLPALANQRVARARRPTRRKWRRWVRSTRSIRLCVPPKM